MSSDEEQLARDQIRLARSGRLNGFHWAVVVGSFVITLSAWHVSKSSLDDRVALRFERESGRAVDLFTERLQQHAHVLQATASFLAAQDEDIGRDDWHRYHEGLELSTLFPALAGINVIHRVRADEAAAFVEQQRGGYPAYTLHPEHDQPFHLAIVHSSTSNREQSLGLDMAHEADRRHAIERAIRTDSPQITAPIRLSHSETRGFLMSVPFYRGRQDGWMQTGTDGMAGAVLALVRTEKLAAGVLARDRRLVWVRISDAGQTLYDEHDRGHPGSDHAPLFRSSITVPMFGREWRFDIESTAAFRIDATSSEPALILAGGLFVDLILLIMFTMLSRANRRTLSFADRVAARGVELEESNRELESFAHVVSHDLKAPLRGIGDLATFIEEDLEPYTESDLADPEVARNLERMHQQVRRADALIGGILSYSQLGNQVEECEPVDTGELVGRVCDGLGIRRDRVALHGEFPVLDTHAIRLDQVLANLIGNAFKYHHDPAHAIVTVTSEGMDATGRVHRFTVADDGPGIEERFHDRIFELFGTLGLRDDVDSTGVGLSIVKKTVELMGGRITVESAPGAGTSFSFDWVARCAGEHRSVPKEGVALQPLRKAA